MARFGIFIKKQSTRQIEWVLDYLYRMTYSDAQNIWEKWPVLAGDHNMNEAPDRPTQEKVIWILQLLEKKGHLIRDPHHFNEKYAYFHVRKQQIWNTFKRKRL